jgi:hypothetical protein
MAGPREVPEAKVRERPPSTLRNIDSGSPGGARAGDLGVPTINAKKVNGRPPWRVLAAGPAAATTEVGDVDGGPSRGAGGRSGNGHH